MASEDDDRQSFSALSSDDDEEEVGDVDEWQSRPSWPDDDQIDELDQRDEQAHRVDAAPDDHKKDPETYEVAMHAWAELSIHSMHATTQQRLALGLQYSIIGINLATALMATIEAQVVVDDVWAAALDHTEPSDDVSQLRLLMVLLPLASGLCLALLKGFNFGVKAASLEYSSAAIRSEIYRWRTRTGEYVSNFSKTGSRRQESRVESNRRDELRCRKRFREHVSHLQMGDAPAWHGKNAADGQAATFKTFASLSTEAGKKVLMKTFAHEGQRIPQEASERELKELMRDDGDDGWSPLDHDEYIDFRLNPVLGMFRTKVPELELQLQACQVAIFCLTALCVLLSAMDTTLWLPLTLLLTASISAVGDVLQLHAKLLATSRALAQLKELQLWWSSLEQNTIQDSKGLRLEQYGTRKDHFSFGLLVDGVETATLAGLGTGVPYASRKVTPWRAEDERSRQKMLEKKKGKTSKRKAQAENEIEEVADLRQENEELNATVKTLYKDLRREKEQAKTQERSFSEKEEKFDRKYKRLETKLRELEALRQKQHEQVKAAVEEDRAVADAGLAGTPREKPWAEEEWNVVKKVMRRECEILGYGTEEAWHARHEDFRGRSWDALSPKQQLAANRLGLYKSHFGSTRTEHYRRPTLAFHHAY